MQQQRLRGFTTLGFLCLFGTVSLLVGCQKKFRTEARYAALKNGYTMTISGQGEIPSGADIARKSTGIVTFESQKAGLRTFSWHCRSLEEVLFCSSAQTKTGGVRWRRLQSLTSFRTFLKDSKITIHSEAELRESKEVIEGVLAGPKGTRMQKQTKVLKVLKVKANYL